MSGNYNFYNKFLLIIKITMKWKFSNYFNELKILYYVYSLGYKLFLLKKKSTKFKKEGGTEHGLYMFSSNRKSGKFVRTKGIANTSIL